MTTTIDDVKLDEIEHVIETLDTAFELGEPTIHPVTKKLISDADYDKLYGKNGSERAILKKNRPDSNTFKGVTASKTNFAKATKCIHNPPMTSIDKADGSVVKKYKRLGEWMLDCLSRMNLETKYTRDLFKTDGKDDPQFILSLKEVEDTLEKLAELKDIKGHPVFVQSLKHDGCAVSLYYKQSKLQAAGNRPRDGINAASVLDHVKQVVGIPNSLLVKDLDIIIRGEVELKVSDFEKVNAEAKAIGERVYENPRNATAGAMNPLGDPTVARKRKLSFVGYSILRYDNAPYTTAIERAIWANKTLKVPFIRINPFKFSDLKNIEDNIRSQLDYAIDGIIIEVNDLEAAENMGHSGDSLTGDPRAKIAWKFAAEKAKAVVKSIVWTTKRSGKVTPVVHFDGIRLAGTTVRKCTVHNARQAIDGGVGEGAEIIVYKAGEIIPFWSETIKSVSVRVPNKCSSCGENLNWSSTDIDLLCENDLCPARHVDSLKHYLKQFGVKGIAESTVTALIEAGLVQTFADFYRLTPEKLVKIAGFTNREAVLDYARIHMVESPEKEKDDSKLLVKADTASQYKKSITLAKFIASLGIPSSGKGTGSSLAMYFSSLEAIRKAKVSDFEKASDIGTKTAEVLYNWFNKNSSILDDLLQYIELEKPKTGIFNGKNFCFSGSFFPDKETWIGRVENLGAKVTTTPSKKTDFFVYGSGSGLKKEKAEEFKKEGYPISLIEIDDLEKLMGLDKDDERSF